MLEGTCLFQSAWLSIAHTALNKRQVHSQAARARGRKVAENEGSTSSSRVSVRPGATRRESEQSVNKNRGSGWRGVCTRFICAAAHHDRRLHRSAPPANLPKKARNIPPVLARKMLRNSVSFARFSGVANNPPPPPRVFRS